MRKIIAAVIAALLAPMVWTWDGLKWISRRAFKVPEELDQPSEGEVELAQAREWTPPADAVQAPAWAWDAFAFVGAKRTGQALPDVTHLPVNVQQWLAAMTVDQAKAAWTAKPTGIEAHVSGRALIERVPEVPAPQDAERRMQEAYRRAERVLARQRQADKETSEILGDLIAAA